jgi:glycogen debranching enzyme
MKPDIQMKMIRRIAMGSALAAVCLALLPGAARPQTAQKSLELSRDVRPWEFLSAVGTRAGIFGNESGNIEAWVYPLKIFRDFHLRFLTDGKALPAESLARTVIVRPESTTIVYAGDTFSVKETFFVPVNEPGAVIWFEVETEQPLEIEAAFHRDFQLEWPAGLAATFIDWDANLHAFSMGEESKKYWALIGSPTAGEMREEYQTNYSASDENSVRLGVTQKGREGKVLTVAASVQGRADAEATYRKLSTTWAVLQKESADYYRGYLAQTVSVELPDHALQEAYDWSRISMLQGVVSNPFLGKGLIAGYRTSGTSQRPGFAWFFGRDSLWTDFALDASGDFATTRMALEFISKYQREDGKIPHEIAQGANFVNWFKDYPYPYASADATPLYILAMNDYVVESGDVAFAKEKWDSIWKAYQFLLSTYDTNGLPKNFGVGHGWIEGGPLLPVKSELYQSGLGAQALSAGSNLAHLTGKEEISTDLSQSFPKQKDLVNSTFWIAGKNRFAFAIDNNGKQVDELTVLAAVPMWFGLLDDDRSQSTLRQLSGFEHQTDWGMRIISGNSAHYSGGGYHYGSVWPLFTGWASVAEYRHHQPISGYQNLQANAGLAMDGAPGHVTEVLSGDYYQPLATSSPHQIWSAAMVVSPVLRGLFGLETDAINSTLKFAPHVPAQWEEFSIGNIRIGINVVGLSYKRMEDGVQLEATRTRGAEECTLEFRPAVSPRAKVLKVDLNGKPIPFRVESSPTDQHVVVRLLLNEGKYVLRIHLQNDFDFGVPATLPALGSSSEGMRVLTEDWSTGKDQLTLEITGVAGRTYALNLLNAEQIETVDGGSVSSGKSGGVLSVEMPSSATEHYTRKSVVLHFATAGAQYKRKKH